jgi:rhodanese-related sulfurtransferase
VGKNPANCASDACFRLKQFASKLALYCASGRSSMRAATAMHLSSSGQAGDVPASMLLRQSVSAAANPM